MPNDVRKLVDKYFSKCHQIIQKTQKDMEIVHDTNLKLLKEAGFAEIAASFVRLQRCNAARYVIGVDARRVHRLQQCNNTTILYQVICYNNYNNYKCISSYLLQQLQQLQVYIKLYATTTTTTTSVYQVICYNNYNNYKCISSYLLQIKLYATTTTTTTSVYQVICYNNYKCISSYLLQQLQQLQVYIKLSATTTTTTTGVYQVICYNNYNNYKCLHNKVFTSSYKLSLTDDESTP